MPNMTERRVWGRLLDAATVAAAIAAVAAVVLLYRGRSSSGRALPAAIERSVDDWREIAAAGHRLGADRPAVRIIEFGDYECPACRQQHRYLAQLLQWFAGDIAVSYRHWPLEYHRAAYPAAKLAVCAEEQEAFHAVHDALYTRSEWLSGGEAGLFALATQAGIADTSVLRVCLESSKTTDRIEADIAVARKLGGGGTPTFLVNDRLVERLPDSTAMAALISATTQSR